MALLSENQRALITGVTGLDQASLAQLLLNKGYEVHCAKRSANRHQDHRSVDDAIARRQARRGLGRRHAA